MEIYMVGGCVRDEFLGVKSNDIDYSVVLSPDELPDPAKTVNAPTPFAIMLANLKALGFEVFLETPEHLTVRARFPDNYFTVPAPNNSSVPILRRSRGLTADFVLARKEGLYSDGRRPDNVQIGTLEDDLARRDFTMNAIAKSVSGEIIDPFNGVQDINERVIRAVGSAADRLNEDALRAVRALRFYVTTGFRLDHEVMFAMQMHNVLDKVAGRVVSDERIKDELNKMLAFDSLASVIAFNKFPSLTAAMFSGRVSLESTMKQRKGR